MKKKTIKSIYKHAQERKALTARAKALVGAKACFDKKATDILILDVRNVTDIADFFLICSASNPRQAQAIADAIQEELAKKKIKANHVEGIHEATWVLVDYIDVVFHIFHEDTREFYRLEDLWGDAVEVKHKYGNMKI